MTISSINHALVLRAAMNLFASTEPSRKLLPASGVELLDYHLAHGGRVNDRNGDWLCWPIVPDDAEADA